MTTPDESHQHAVLTPTQIREILDEARKIRQAIDNDAANPVGVGFLEAARYGSTTSPFKALQKAYLDLGKRLDVYALALLQVTAPQCDRLDSHDPATDLPTGDRCEAAATHRIEWSDGRYSFGCDAHLEIDGAATVKPIAVIKIEGRS